MDDAACHEELKDFRSEYASGHRETMAELRRVEDRLTDRLDKGGDRMDGLDSRVRAIETESDTHPALPPVHTIAPHVDPPSKLPWYLVAALTAVITTVGPQLWNAGIDFLFHLQHGAKP